jgi:hypothetical protein
MKSIVTCIEGLEEIVIQEIKNKLKKGNRHCPYYLHPETRRE